MLLVGFILGGLCGYLLAAVLCVGSENTIIKALEMERDKLKQEVLYWQKQAMSLRKQLPNPKVTSDSGSDSNG